MSEITFDIIKIFETIFKNVATLKLILFDLFFGGGCTFYSFIGWLLIGPGKVYNYFGEWYNHHPKKNIPANVKWKTSQNNSAVMNSTEKIF